MAINQKGKSRTANELYKDYKDATNGLRPSRNPFLIGELAGKIDSSKFTYDDPRKGIGKGSYGNNALIMRGIDSGRSVVASTFLTGPTGHVVNIIGYSGNNWIVNDPAGDRNLGAYGRQNDNRFRGVGVQYKMNTYGIGDKRAGYYEKK